MDEPDPTATALRPVVRELRAVVDALADHVDAEPRVVLALLARAGRLVGEGIVATVPDAAGTGRPPVLDAADPVARRHLVRQWSRDTGLPGAPGHVHDRLCGCGDLPPVGHCPVHDLDLDPGQPCPYRH